MSFLLGLAGFLLTIGIIVIVHEGGHFFTAKFFNIKVTRFSFGMGPVLWRRRKGETEYCFSALPLGGYVRMADEADADLTEDDRKGSTPVRPAGSAASCSLRVPPRTSSSPSSST